MAAREDTAQPAGLHLSISEEGKTARSSQGEKTNTTQKSESSVHLKFQCVISVPLVPSNTTGVSVNVWCRNYTSLLNLFFLWILSLFLISIPKDVLLFEPLRSFFGRERKGNRTACWRRETRAEWPPRLKKRKLVIVRILLKQAMLTMTNILTQVWNTAL